METAPLLSELADGPDGGKAVWVRADDGTRLRVGGWRTGGSGTVLLFNGRTEYVEKYGRMARRFAEADLSTVTVDWRGQGLSDRVAANKRLGHVARFSDYQKDAAAFLTAARELGFPEPYHLLAHSMGGAIGLRALSQGLPVRSAVFSAPMWGINLPAWVSPLKGVIVGAAHALGLGQTFAPGTGPTPYPFTQAFEGNGLTHDPESYDWLRAHIRAEPLLGLGGPSMHWLREAFGDIAELSRLTDVPCPTLVTVGSEESVVDPAAVRRLSIGWHRARLEILPDCRHEAMMELLPVRDRFTEEAIAQMQAA